MLRLLLAFCLGCVVQQVCLAGTLSNGRVTVTATTRNSYYSCWSKQVSYTSYAIWQSTHYAGVYGNNNFRTLRQYFMFFDNPGYTVSTENSYLSIDVGSSSNDYNDATQIDLTSYGFRTLNSLSADFDFYHSPFFDATDTVVVSGALTDGTGTKTISIPSSFWSFTWSSSNTLLFTFQLKDTTITDRVDSGRCDGFNQRLLTFTSGTAKLSFDLNECATSNGGCDSLTTCTNTDGSYTCGACPTGYSGTGATSCTDINECATSNGGCDPVASCTNSAGSFTCGSCPNGYSGDGYTGCIFESSASMTSTTKVLTDTCSNGAPDYTNLRTITSAPYYVGVGGASGSQTLHQILMFFPAPAVQVGGAANLTFTLYDQSNAGEIADLISYGLRTSTSDLSPTNDFYLSPSLNAATTPVQYSFMQGSYTANVETTISLPSTFFNFEWTSGYLLLALEINNTALTTTASTSCSLSYIRFRLTGAITLSVETEVNECETSNGGCDALTTCTNSIGSFSCGACPAGYSGSGSAGCTDVNECATSNGGCDALTSCTNSVGSFTCGTCPSGYTGTGDSGCVDINECETANGGCDALTTCTNVAGSRVCGDCPSGYTGSGNTGCVDINECATSNGGCDILTTCTNSAGTFSCGACPSGYSGSGNTTCVDINECETSNGGCDALTSCTNTAGSLQCGACPAGYDGTGSTGCTDINECATSNGGCVSLCFNSVGSYTCGCNDGYVYNDATFVCDDVNECETNNGGCDALTTCTNIAGSFICGDCPGEYAGDGSTGCTNSTVFRCKSDQFYSWYTCSGGTPDFTTLKYSTNSLAIAGVAGGSGSQAILQIFFFVEAPTVQVGGAANLTFELYGQDGSSKTADLISYGMRDSTTDSSATTDYLQSPYFAANTTVVEYGIMDDNTPTGFVTVSLPSTFFNFEWTSGYMLFGITLNHSLVETSKTSCSLGSYTRFRTVGTMNLTITKEVNECETDNGGCDVLTTCTNSIGSYTCSACPTGYSGTGETGCTDINECETNNGGCDPLVTCTNTVSSYSCGSCPGAYSGDGYTGCLNSTIYTFKSASSLCIRYNCNSTFYPDYSTLTTSSGNLYMGTAGGTNNFALGECFVFFPAPTVQVGGAANLTFTIVSQTGTDRVVDLVSYGLRTSTSDITPSTDYYNVDTFSASTTLVQYSIMTENTTTGDNTVELTPKFFDFEWTSGYLLLAFPLNHSIVADSRTTCSLSPVRFVTSSEMTLTVDKEINECDTNNGGCDPLSTCTNSIGSFSCGSCPTGYSGTGYTSCDEINECATNNGGCDLLTVCTNSAGSYSCGACPAGYSGSGDTSCDDINECTTSNGGCSALSNCTNTVGSYECGNCFSGYAGHGSTNCTDVNECATNNAGCDPKANCTNLVGSFYCTCDSNITCGSTSSSTTSLCTSQFGTVAPDFTFTFEIPENETVVQFSTCGASTFSTSLSLLRANNSIVTSASELSGCGGGTRLLTKLDAGSYSIVVDGTTASNSGSFNLAFEFCNVNECQVDNGGCDALVTCSRDSFGNTVCGACPVGYAGNGTVGCTDINECLTNNGGCDSTQTCVNSVGSFTCDCQTGYRGGDKPIITVDNQDSAYFSTFGKWFFQNDSNAYNGNYLRALYIYEPEGYAIQATFSPAIPAVGSYDVYVHRHADSLLESATPFVITHANGTSNVVVDQATGSGFLKIGTYPFSPTSTSTISLSTSGTSKYIVADAIQLIYVGFVPCYDINECATANGGCDLLTTCTNLPSTFSCGNCPSGYSGNATSGCFDINECATSNGGCDLLTTCNNTMGSFFCGSCPQGYSGNGTTGCKDINECATANGGCDSLVTCTNLPGNHSCGSCPVGYSGDGYSGCTDINECQTNNGGCAYLRPCTNSAGSFSCGGCPSGYFAENSSAPCQDINECATNQGGCDVLTTCINYNGTFGCSDCPSGYSGSGLLGCKDINECATNNGGCDLRTDCTNLASNFSCGPCPTGYSGTGLTGCVAVIVLGCFQDDPTQRTLSLGPLSSTNMTAPICNSLCAALKVSCPIGECDRDQTGSCISYGDGLHCAVENCSVVPSWSRCWRYKNQTYFSYFPGGSYFGVQNFTDCYCGDYNDDYARIGEVDSTFCDTPCSGDAAFACGGETLNTVYDINECLVENGGCDPLTHCSNTVGSFACGVCPDGYTGTGDTGCEVFLFDYQIQFIDTFGEGWSMRSARDLFNTKYILNAGLENLVPSYWKDEAFLHVQGALNVGTSMQIFELPDGFRPEKDSFLICNTAPDDTRWIAAPILIHVATNGSVVVASNPFNASSITLRGRLGLQGANATWSTLEPAPNVTVLQTLEQYRDPVTGSCYLRGRLLVTSPCPLSSPCLVLSNITVPTLSFSGALWPQMTVLDSTGTPVVSALNVTANGDVYLVSSANVSSTEVFLDGVVLVEERVVGVTDSESPYNINDFSDDNDIRVLGLNVNPDLTSTNARIVVQGGPEGLVTSRDGNNHRSSVVQLAGSVQLATYLFNNTQIASLGEEFIPEKHEKHIVPCMISPNLLLCAVYVSVDGSVRIWHDRPNEFDPDDDGHWISLDSVFFGGYAWKTSLGLFGENTQIFLEGASMVYAG